MGAVAEAIAAKLQVLSPSRLDIVDDSARHAGHEGAREGGESHFSVTIESAAFAGVNRVGRQRLNRERVQRAGQLLGQRPVDHPLPRHLGGSGERLRLDQHVEMAFATRRGAGVARVAVRVVDDLQPDWLEGGGQLVLDCV